MPTTQLSFLAQENWSDLLKEKLDHESADLFRELLIPAAEGIGYCIDERPIKTGDSQQFEAPKPAFVGGAAGWVVLFLVNGQTLDEAVASTIELYQENGWGELQIHTDDHAPLGCGFLNVQQKVIATLQSLKIPGLLENLELVEGQEIFDALKEVGAKVVTLTGKHKTGVARVVINQVEGTTLDRPALYDINPAFLWDAWATTGDSVLNSYNELSGNNLDAKSFFHLQAALHLATGIHLGAVELENEQKNVVNLAE